MSGKLDQSLDEILSTRPKGGRGRGRGRRVPNATRVTTAAPAGGIQKSTRAKATAKSAITNGAVPVVGDSKIIVSNLVRQHFQHISASKLIRPALRCQRSPDQGMFHLRPTNPWTFSTIYPLPLPACGLFGSFDGASDLSFQHVLDFSVQIDA